MRSLSPCWCARRRGAALELALSLALALAVAGAAPLGASEKREARSLMDRFKKPPGEKSDDSGERESSSDNREKKRDTGRKQDQGRDRDKDRDSSSGRDRDRGQSKDRDRDRDSSRDRDKDRDRDREKERDRWLWRDEEEREWRWNRYDRPYRALGGYYGAGAAAPAVVYPAYTQPPRGVVSPPLGYDGGYYSDSYVRGQGYREGYRDYRSGGVQPGYGYSEARSWTGYAPPPSLVRRAQSRLATMGYYNGTADGVIGPRTRSAIERLQYDYRLPVTGELDDPTLRVLGL